MSEPPEYDPRIAMDPSYVRFKRPRRRTRGERILRFLLPVLVVPTVIVLAIAGLELWLGHDPHLPSIEKPSDYRPERVARLYARTGEVVAETDGVRRTLVPTEVPPRIARAIIARWEPAFLERPALGQRDLGRTLLAHLRGRSGPEPLTVLLARALTKGLPDQGPFRLVKEWIVAMRLERHLTRPQILRLFVDELPFGAGRFGIEEAARVTFGRAAGSLDDAQAKALADLAGDESGPVVKAPPPKDAAGCGREALRVVTTRMTSDALAHFSGPIVTPCDPALTRIAEAALHRQHLERAGLGAAVVMMRLPSNEVAVVVGSAGSARPLGVMRVPLVIGQVLNERKRTAASRLGEASHTSSLRALTAQSPTKAADMLVAGGLNRRDLQELAVHMGLASTISPDGIADGTALVSALEATSLLATLAAGGQHRLPQYLVSIGGEAEPEGVKAQLPVLDPSASYIATSLLQLPAAVRDKIARPVAGVVGGDLRSAWFGGYGPDLVVVVWVGADGAAEPAKGADPTRLAAAIGTELFLGATRGRPAHPFARPAALLVRRVDDQGRLLARSSTAGTEEWFVPGSLPREEIELPPEDPPSRQPAPEDEDPTP